MANYNLFLNRPVVPQYARVLPPEEQYGPNTSEVAKIVSNYAKYPAYKVDNFIQGHFGGIGRYATDAIDIVLKGTQIPFTKIKIPGIIGEDTKPTRQAADVPLLRAFIVRNPIGSVSESVDKFYDNYDKLQKEEARLKKYLSEGRSNDFYQFRKEHPEIYVIYDEKTNTHYMPMSRAFRQLALSMSGIRKIQRQILKNDKMSSEEKRERITKLDTMLTEMSRRANTGLDTLNGRIEKDKERIVKEMEANAPDNLR
jgi:hypothetical protein